ncbi:MAG: hypothetical protein NTX61_01625 [Bacteroidetes bacterium]|nr:hypothetical protein [Bacteroidota bacterium]
MKTNKYFLTVVGFVTGLASGISVIGLLAFSSAAGPSGSASVISPVTAANANIYFKNYLAGAASFNQVIKGFTLDKAQLDAMNSIAKENSLLTGYRIYFGKDNNARKIAIVVGVDANGTDAVNNTIYNTTAISFNPCPPVCDSGSPITKN